MAGPFDARQTLEGRMKSKTFIKAIATAILAAPAFTEEIVGKLCWGASSLPAHTGKGGGFAGHGRQTIRVST